VIAVGRGARVTRLSFGHHGYYPTPEGPDQVGEYFVAGVDAFGRLVDRPGANNGWCIAAEPQVDGAVHTLLPASSEADARARMAGFLGTD
jgi:hypothetical protein